MVLTSASVINRFGDADILVRRDGEPPSSAGVRWLEPRAPVPGLDALPLPDLAVLQIPGATAVGHPCVWLGETPTGGPVMAAAFVPGRLPVETVDGDIARVRSEPDGKLVVYRSEEPGAGLGGGPLLSLDSGRVVGVVKADRFDPDGSQVASVVEALRMWRPDIWAMNQAFHRSDKRWQQALRPESAVRDPLGATRRLLKDTLQAVARRTWSLPPLKDRSALHQTVWVRRVPQSSTHRVARGPSEFAAAERFHWQPTRAGGRVTVVRGLPGYGKSWLLAFHAETLAQEGLMSLEAGTDPERLRIPLLADCATFGYHLPANPSMDQVATALLRSTRATDPHSDPADDAALLACEVLDQGRAVICLDAVDEVPKLFRRRVQTALRLLAAGTNTLVISTRHSSLALLEEISASDRVDVETLGFTHREASRFIGVWLDHDPERRRPLDRALANSASLTAVASVPLLLSFLCRLADVPGGTTAFPTSKAQLCEEVVKSLLSGRWRSLERNAYDPDDPPDPVRRLKALSHAFGTMLDGWRSSMESVPRARLSRLLADHPDAERLRASAVARWETWQRASEAEPTQPPPDPVVWEFTFDGLLVDDGPGGSEPAVKALHSALRDFLLATYVAGLDQSARRDVLERHRYFDADWQEVFVLAASLLDSPDALVRDILDLPKDPWFSQAYFAARCVAECGDRVSEDTANRLLGVLVDEGTSPRLSDSRRRLAAFGQLVRAGVAPAVARAVAASAEEEPAPAEENSVSAAEDSVSAAEDVATADAEPGDRTTAAAVAEQGTVRERRLEAITALAELGHPEGIGRAERLLSPSVPQQTRQRLITALAATDSPRAIDRAVDFLLTAGRNTDVEAFVAALRPSSTPLLEAAERLLRARSLQKEARVALAAALMECGNTGTGIVRAVAHDVTSDWALRSRLYTLLINAGVPNAVEEAMDGLAHPTLRPADKSYVIEALIRQGIDEALTSAASLMVDTVIPWARRRELAAAVCTSGPAGLELVRSQCTRHAPLDMVFPHLLALVAAGDPAGCAVARDFCNDPAVVPGARGFLCHALLEAAPGRAETDAALSMAGSDELTAGHRFRLVTALARAAAAETTQALHAALARGLDDVSWPLVSRQLAAASEPGRQALLSVVGTDTHSWRIRVESVLALATTHEDTVRRAVAELNVPGMPALWRSRLVFGLSLAGSAMFVPELAASLRTTRGAYEVFYRFMQGPNASLDEHFHRYYADLAEAMEQLPQRGAAIAWNDDLLSSCGITWESDEERRALLAWSYEQIQERVGKALHDVMLPDQLNAFSAAIDDSDEGGAFDWMISNFPEYQEFVQEELKNLKEDLQSGRLVPPDSLRNDHSSVPTMRALQHVAKALAGLPVIGPGRSWAPYFDHIRSHRHALLTDHHASSLLELAYRLDPRWPLHHGQLFTILHCRAEGVDATEALSRDSSLHIDLLNNLYGQGDFWMLYLCGSFGAQCFPRDAPTHFYAALGAEGLAHHDLAVRLMGISGEYAEDWQVAQGTQTIRECGERHRWEPSASQDLIDALAGRGPGSSTSA
ncbi:DUF5663 domain-containing protein [Streptomyces sp. NEAU-NA10]|uniref:DUF5663 domain-containing protein n=1 Tax=Streptomyces sp. NEAU-NA10 TaxID=3416050 RepID=UPI003CC5E02C